MNPARPGVPSWVAQLEAPPAARAKVPGVADPLGFAPSASGASKARPPPRARGAASPGAR